MKLKLDDAGHVVLDEGKPVYVHDDGREAPFDAASTLATISRLNGEAKAHRERAEAAEKALKPFEGLDPKAAAEAIKTIANIDAKKLVDAGEIDRVRAEIIASETAKYEPVVKERDALQSALQNEMIGGSFARSKFIAENLAIPADLVQSRFGSHFKIEEGKIMAYDGKGELIRDPTTAYEPAGFDDALRVIVGQYANKDSILKGSGSSGSGAQGGSGRSMGRTMSRAQFNALAPAEQASTARDASAGKVSITD